MRLLSTMMLCLLALLCLGSTVQPARAADPEAWINLCYAVQNDDVAQVKTCLKAAAKHINYNDGEVLQNAVGLLRDPKIIGLLLGAGANPNLRQKNTGYNALHIALKECNAGTIGKVIPIVKLLVAKGCDVNMKDENNGYTPLHVAARNQNVSKEIFAVLLSPKNVDVNIRCKQINPNMDGAWPALFYAIGRTSDPTNSNKDIVQMLIARGSDIKAMSTDKAPAEKRSWTVMHFVADANNDRADIATILLAAGAPLDQSDTSDMLTPLHVAMAKNNPKICQFLLEKGADYRSKDREGTSVIDHSKGWGRDKHLESAEVIIRWAEAHK